MLSKTLLTVGITLEASLESLSLLLLSQAGWLLPALVPFMHAHVDPQLSHTPDSHIFHMKIIGSKLHFFALSHLGPTAWRHVPSPCAEPWLSSRAFLQAPACTFSCSAPSLRFWGHISYCWAAINPALPPKAPGCTFFSWGIYLTTVCMSTHWFCLQLLFGTFSMCF